MAKIYGEGWFSPRREASWNWNIPLGAFLEPILLWVWWLSIPSCRLCSTCPHSLVPDYCPDRWLSHSINSTNHLLTLWWVLATCLSGPMSPGPSQDRMQLLDVILRQQNQVSSVWGCSAFNVPGWTSESPSLISRDKFQCLPTHTQRLAKSNFYGGKRFWKRRTKEKEYMKNTKS